MHTLKSNMFARVLIGLVALGMTATMAPAAWADPTPEPEPSQSAVAEPDDGTQTPPPETPAVDDPVLGEPEPVVGTAAGWADRQGDAVWGTIKLYQASVDTWAELKEALDSVGAYSSVPYVILINDSFTMGDMYTLTNKNVVLRKTISAVVYTDTAAGEKYWDYSNPYSRTTASSPTLYDLEEDWKITSAAGVRHFTLSGTNAALVTENITLQGLNAGVNYPDIGKNSTAGGGVTLTAVSNTIAVNIADVGGGSTGQTGAAIQIRGTTLTSVNIVGGVLSHNHAGGFGGAAVFCNWATGGATVNISGYTIIENNYSQAEGGAIYWNGHSTDVINLRDNVILRNNTGGDGGGIHMQGNLTVNLRDNVSIENNRTLNVARTATLFPGNGAGIWVTAYSGTSTMVLNVYDNATIQGNQAARGGGGIAVGNSAAAGSATVNLYGGRIIGNAALGTARDLEGSLGVEYQLSDVYSIGGGGGIYAYDPKAIKIPANSTVTFSGNTGAFSAFVDNDYFAKPNEQKDPFFVDDTYSNHILKADVPTSVVNAHGPKGYDYFNLYNNYDIGTPNNLSIGLFTPVSVATVPADGSGGQVIDDGANAYLDPLNTGKKQAVLNSTLKYTTQAEAGWFLKSFTAVTDPALSSSELAAAWTNNGGVYSLVVPASDTKLVATFHRKAVLAAPAVTFPVNYSAGGYSQPLPINVTLTNTTPSGSYSESATAVTGTLTGGDASLFTLSSASVSVAAGAVDTSWQVRPKDSGFGTAKTYSTTLQVTYNNGSEQATLNIPVSMEVANAGDLYLPGSEAGGAYDFGTSISSGEDYVPDATQKAITITSVGGDLAATEVSVGLANQLKDGTAPGDWFTLSGSQIAQIPSGGSTDTPYWIVPARRLAPGDYTADLTWTYKVNNVTQNKTAAKAVHFKVVTPAAVAITSDIEFAAKNVGYPTDALSYIPVALANSGGTAAQVTKIELTGANAASFRIAGAAAGDGSETVATVAANGANSGAWSIIPKADLPAGTHAAQVQVTYRTGVNDETATASASVSFKVVGPPHITAQPAAVSVFTDDAATLTVEAADDDGDMDGLTYQWYSNVSDSNTGGTLIDSGGTAASFSAPTSAAGTVYYYCVVSNQAGSVVSQAAAVVVTGRTYTATVSATSKVFPDAAYGYGPVAAQTFTLTNTGNQPLTKGSFALFLSHNDSPFEIVAATNDGEPAQLLSSYLANIGTIAVGASATVSVRPKQGLAASDVARTDSLVLHYYTTKASSKLVSLSFTVHKATPQVVWPSAPAVMYGDALPGLSGGSDSGGGSFAWQDDQVVPTVSNSGYTVVLTPGDTTNFDYAQVELTRTVPVTVAKRQLTGDWTASGKTYDGTKSAQVSFAPSNKVAGDAVSVSFVALFADAAAGLGKPVTVSDIAVDNANYLAPAPPEGLSAGISKGVMADLPDQVVDAVENTSASYQVGLGALLPRPVAPQALGQVGYTVGDVTDPDQVLAGVPQIVLGSAGTSDDQVLVQVNLVAYSESLAPARFKVSVHTANYADFSVQVQVLVTSKTPVTVSGVRITDKTFDGAPNVFKGTLAATPAEALGALVVSYEGRDGTSYGPSTDAPTGAGDYTLRIGIPGDNLAYKGGASWSFSITKRQLDVTAADVALSYGDTLPDTPQVGYTGFADGDNADSVLAVAAQASWPVPDTHTPGEYVISFATPAQLTADAANNYVLAHHTGKLTVNAVAPAAPAGLAATAGDGQVALAWTTPDDGGTPIIRFEVQTDTGLWQAIPASTAGTLSHTVTGLLNGTGYSFKVRAVNTAGPGAASDTVTATPQSGDASLVSVANTPVGAVSGNGTAATPEQVTVQVPNLVGVVNAGSLASAQGSTAELFTDDQFSIVGPLALDDVYPATYQAYVKVTAQNGQAAYYDVAVSRARSSVATLQQVAGVAPVLTGTNDPIEATLTVANGTFEVKTSDLLAGSQGTAELTDATFTNVLAKQPLAVTVNDSTRTDVYVRVTAQDGVTSNKYHLCVTRTPLTDTTLFYVGGQPVTFDDPPGAGTQASPTKGSVAVPHNVDVLSAAAGGNIVPSDSATAAIVASDWSTTLSSVTLGSAQTADIYVVVTAQDLSTKQYYKIKAARKGSSDTSLLSVAGIPATEQVSVGWPVASLTANWFEAAPGATVDLAGGTVNLAAGNNTVQVTVTAEDGQTQHTYTLTVHRRNGDAGLATVLGQTVNLAGAGTTTAAPAVTQITVDRTVDQLALADITTSDPGRTIKLDAASFDGIGIPVLPLPAGYTDAWIKVTAEDTDFVGYYKIRVNRAVPTGTSILQVFGQNITPTSGDGQQTTPFTVPITVPYTTTTLTTADLVLSEAANATTNTELAPGAATTVNITVTAAAGNTAHYKLVIWRNADTAKLTQLLGGIDELIAHGLLEGYTGNSIDDLEDAITAAKTVITQPNLSQAQIDEAYNNVQNALAGLVPLVPQSEATEHDLAELGDLVGYAATLDRAKYTAESFAQVQTQVAAAQELLGQDSPDSHDLAEIKTGLLAALAGLRYHYTIEVRTQVQSVVVKKNKTFQTGALAYLTNGTTQELVYASSDPSVATVNSTGKITGKTTGTATITASSVTPGVDGQPVQAQITITVVSKPPSVKTVSADVPKILGPGQSVDITAAWSKTTAAPGKVTFASSNKKIATVDKTGRLTAVGQGTVKIKVKAGSKSKTYTVRVSLLDAPKPKITGVPAVGVTLVANPGVWGPGEVGLAYQWYRSGKPITGATGPTYLVQPADVGKTITIKITGTKTGYKTATTTSGKTAKIKK